MGDLFLAEKITHDFHYMMLPKPWQEINYQKPTPFYEYVCSVKIWISFIKLNHEAYGRMVQTMDFWNCCTGTHTDKPTTVYRYEALVKNPGKKGCNFLKLNEI